MPRASNQKLKLIYLLRYLERESDENHPLRIQDMQGELRRFDITAERKSLYSDIEALREAGCDIVQERGGYYLASRPFELAELKLLVDSVQASRFITRKKSGELIEKLEGLTSVGEARQLQRQVFVLNRVKTMNESIYYNVDGIHTAIAEGKQIRFRYFDYDMDKTKVYRREGADYQVSPFALTWAEENYYLVAFDALSRQLRHYRVDRMSDLRETEETIEGEESFRAEDIARYATRVFGMFRGEERELRLRFHRHLAGAVLDRFGRELILVPDGKEHFTCTVTVAVSPQFYGWLCGFGGEAALVAPEAEADAFRTYLKDILSANSSQ
ncbi:MAG: WYL domain-containing protein [Oscillospiraceae bacterium]|nr:WYL domain-containing protein [Oscillospiraceae bacterium]